MSKNNLTYYILPLTKGEYPDGTVWGRGYNTCVKFATSRKSAIRSLRLRYITLFFISFVITKAQTKTDQQAAALLRNAFGKSVSEKNMAITFDRIANNISNPKDVFTLPATEIIKDGFLYMDGSQFKMRMGPMKGICDGKIMVMIDEVSKIIFVDSVRKQMPKQLGAVPDVKQLFSQLFGSGAITSEGEETVNGKLCYKIRAEFKGGQIPGRFSLYWIEKSSGQLYFMAESKTGETYNAYVFNKITSAPKKYNYKVRVPKKQFDNLADFQVIDNRFALVNIPKTK